MKPLVFTIDELNEIFVLLCRAEWKEKNKAETKKAYDEAFKITEKISGHFATELGIKKVKKK